MKANRFLILIACATALASCATTAPKELVDARAAYRQAGAGIAPQVAPAELHVAELALARAEQSFKDNKDGYQTRDLAYLAQRKSELAEAAASIVVEQKSQDQAKNDFQATQGQIITKTRADLNEKASALTASQQSGAMTAEKLATEQDARAAADRRAADAQAALARLAAVKDEARGMVITLSGSVLFASNRFVLLPEAQKRLDQVAEVLLSTRERNLVVEGHTDSQGSESANIVLSQGRADAVRSYLVQRGYEGDRIQAHGIGEGHPVADNASAEGRANNRRVEIIISRDKQSSNP